MNKVSEGTQSARRILGECCNHDCDQGRSCNVSSEPTDFAELDGFPIDEPIGLLIVAVVLCAVCAGIGYLVGISA